MKFQTMQDRTNAIAQGKRLFGGDFFMVDPRSEGTIAAPFHIQKASDENVFICQANPSIPWVASLNARYELKAVAVGGIQ